MMSAWHSASDYDPGRSQATTWLTSIARYRSLDLLRKSSRHDEILRADRHNILRVLGHDEPWQADDPLPSATANRLDAALVK